MTVPTSILVAVAMAINATPAPRASKPETPHFAFVKEYIRELSAIQDIRDSAGKDVEQHQGKDTELISDGIHFCTLMQLERRSQIGMLQHMRLDAPFDDLIPMIIKAYSHEIELQQQLIDTSTVFMGGPIPGVDFAKVAAEMPQIRAKLEYVERTLFESTPMVFMTLINMKGSPSSRADRLVITRAERAELLADLTNDFGTKLDQKEKTFTLGSAALLRSALKKGYKCSDEPGTN